MGSKTQRDARRERAKQRQKQREKQKLKSRNRRKSSGFAIVASQNRRIARQKPRAWRGECAEDVAIFDVSVRKKLPPELAEQAESIRGALQLISVSRGQEAINQVANISRSSPLSQWRMLIRGLVSWADGELEEAKACWSRLDRARRPGRIATALTAAHRADLETVKIEPTTGEERTDGTNDELKLDRSTLYAAKLVRRIRVDRRALAQARIGTSQRDEAPDLLIGPRKLLWLKDFSADFRQVEPELVAALQRAALHHAYAQSYVDLFDDVTRAFPGPPHDPKNSLLSFFYHCESQGAERSAGRHLQNYLTRDLPNSREISAPLRSALMSQCYLNEARMEISPSVGGIMGMFRPQENPRAVEANFKKSILAYPANHAAHKEYVSWLQSKLDNDRFTKKQRKPFEDVLPEVMKKWSAALPEDIEPRLWLVDYLLEHEQLDEAQPHVKWLELSRHDDPRVRATPWKWQLLEAMRLCRRKAWLAEVPEKLDTAERLWPSWLAKAWLPYLRIALLLRRGEGAEAQRQRAAVREANGSAPDSLFDGCMMLAAAQRMRVPAADLKPLRQPVDEAVENIKQIDLEQLIAVGGFFWDLHRASLLYPAYRMHGGKFARELFDRIQEQPGMVAARSGDDAFLNALLWLSTFRYFSDGYRVQLPEAFRAASLRVPKLAAAILSVVLKLRAKWRIREYQPQCNLTQEAAKSERDPFYRYWFNSLAEQTLEELSSSRSTSRNPFAAAFAQEFGADLDDDDDPFDIDCDCADCRAAREAAAYFEHFA